MRIGVVGAGVAGTSLGVLLHRGGHEIVAVAGGPATEARAATYLPGVPVIEADVVAARSEVTVLGVPDDRIAQVCADIAPSLPEAAAVLHLSGAEGLDALAPAARRGVRVLALHPLQTLPTVPAALERLPGSGAAVTARDEPGSLLGEGLARDAGLLPFRVAEEDRALYHAGAVFASNHLVASLAAAERIFLAAGIEDPLPLLLPLARASVENVARTGTAAALTGPVVRGDAGTVARNLAALTGRAPDAILPYVAMALAAAELAVSSGRLSAEDREAVEEALRPWR